jgi:anaerobic selenocysteine-containing dehydrogenase
MGMKAPAGTTTTKDRIININNSAQEILDANDPPIKMLWIACRSPLTQAAEPQKLKEAYDKLDLIVTADLFMNPTVRMSDIVLPVTTPFETWGLNVSYWHYWCALNEPAIEPQYEAKSDLEIAMGLSKKLNELEPGSCTFPTEGKLEDWVAAEFTPDFLKQFGLTSWDELKKGPRKAVTGLIGWQDGKFKTPSGKYEFASETAVSEGHELLPVWTEEMKTPEKYPLRLMSPHWKLSINGQFQNLDWMMDIHSEPVVEMHPETAARYHVQNGDMVNYDGLHHRDQEANFAFTMDSEGNITTSSNLPDAPQVSNMHYDSTQKVITADVTFKGRSLSVTFTFVSDTNQQETLNEFYQILAEEGIVGGYSENTKEIDTDLSDENANQPSRAKIH